MSNADSVATPDGGAAIVQCALDAFGRVDIVVNNAGILRDAAFKNVTPESLDAVIDVHLKGAFNVLRTAWPLMREQNYGRDRQHQLGLGAVRQLRPVELRRGQGRAHGSHPGAVDRGRAQQRARSNAIAPIAHTRMTESQMDAAMRPELISPLVAYLCHASCEITGQAYSVGGGRVSRLFLGMTTGITEPDLTAEMIAERIAEIEDTGEFVIRW